MTRHIVINRQPVHWKLNHKFRHLQVEDSLIDYYQIGDKRQKFDVIIDTGSSDLWVPQVGADGFDGLKRKQLYDCSSSCYDTGEALSVNYDDGHIEGKIIWDQVSFSGNKNVLKNQSLLLINDAEDNMKNSPGLMGLSFQAISSNPNPTVLQTMVDEHIIPSKMFSLYLTDIGKQGSRIIFGGVDLSLLKDPQAKFIYADLVRSYEYMIGIKGIMVGSELFQISAGLVDSGTSCLTMPSSITDKIKESFLSSYGIHCVYHVEKYAENYSLMSCYTDKTSSDDIIKQFPKLSVAIDDKQQLELNPQDYIYKCKIINQEDHKTVCMTKLERSKVDQFVLLGDAFLQSFYTIFDQDKRQLGFAHSINNGQIQIVDG